MNAKQPPLTHSVPPQDFATSVGDLSKTRSFTVSHQRPDPNAGKNVPLLSSRPFTLSPHYAAPSPENGPILQRAPQPFHCLRSEPAVSTPRAGSSILQPKMNFKPEQLSGLVSVSAKISSAVKGLSTFVQIKTILKHYWQTQDPNAESKCLEALDTLAQGWLLKHSNPKGKDALQKAELLTQMRQAIASEQRNLQMQPEYLQNISERKFKFFTDYDPGMDVPLVFADDSETENGNDSTMPDGLNKIPQERRDDAQKYGLLEAEMRALRAYSKNDYLYMNPLLADNEAWLNQSIKRLLETSWSGRFEGKKGLQNFSADEVDQLKQEAKIHTQFAVSGLEKLPNTQLLAYRGLVLSPEDFASQYREGETVTFPSFTSTSSKSSTAYGFALSGGQGKVSVILKIDVRFGKDIAPLVGDGEAEVLILPGAQFQVISIQTIQRGGKELKEVRLVQIK